MKTIERRDTVRKKLLRLALARRSRKRSRSILKLQVVKRHWRKARQFRFLVIHSRIVNMTRLRTIRFRRRVVPWFRKFSRKMLVRRMSLRRIFKMLTQVLKRVLLTTRVVSPFTLLLVLMRLTFPMVRPLMSSLRVRLLRVRRRVRRARLSLLTVLLLIILRRKLFDKLRWWMV